MFELNLMLRPHLVVFIDLCGLPHQYKNESGHKTDCCNEVSDFHRIFMVSLQRHLATISAGDGAAAGLWTRS